jgi:hypothetical protein
MNPALSFQPMTPGAANGFRVRFCNMSGGTIDDPALRFSYIVIR